MLVVIIILMLMIKLTAVVVMPLSAVMLTTDINDIYINIFVFVNFRVTWHFVCRLLCMFIVLTIQRKVVIIMSVFLRQVHLIIKKCHQNLLVKNWVAHIQAQRISFHCRIRVRVSRSDVAEDSFLLGCYILPFDAYFPTLVSWFLA
jgi:hypothetical protein